MKSFLARMMTWTWRWGLFVRAAFIVILAVVSLDSLVIEQRLYLFRTGSLEDLIIISVLGILIGYVLKHLLVLQWKWGMKQ